MILRPRQKIFVGRSVHKLEERGNTLGVAPTGCHAPGTPIMQHDGDIAPVESIRVGDALMGPDGQPRFVLELHRGEDEMFEIRPIKGDAFVVNASHVLSLVRTNEGTKGSHNGAPGGGIFNIPVSDYLNQNAYFKHLHKLYRVTIDFPPLEEPPLDPYFLGLLLGDGSLTHGTPGITTPDPEIVEYCQAMADRLGLRLRTDQMPGNEANTYYFPWRTALPNPLTEILRKLGVYGLGSSEKRIPRSYKLGSRHVRAAILAGLLDTDGYQNKSVVEYTTASVRLAEDVAFVARSLGFLALPRQKIVNGAIYYRFYVCGDFAEVPMRVGRKIPAARKQKKNPLRTGFTVHHKGRGPYFGFTVTGDGLYLMGDFTVTHNSGKTIMLSAVVGQILNGSGGKACVLAHRDEITAQNVAKFQKVNPRLRVSVVDAKTKSWDGDVVFAMVQTLSRENNLAQMPPLGILVVDEVQHVAADTYKRIINAAKSKNPSLKLYGVTATPNRGDGKSLRNVFDNCADQIGLGEMIASGQLVRPRTFVIDLGVRDDLNNVRRLASEFDMAEVAEIMDRSPITDAIVRHWKERAGDRRTVTFCSTVEHARHVLDAFVEAGVKTEMVTGETPEVEREEVFRRLDSGETQMLVNVAIAIEGWDCPPISCVVLLRPCSHKSTFVQMVGRGLRKIEPDRYPGLVKSDCVVLDFGTSALTHGSLEQDIDLDSIENESDHERSGIPPLKICPECNAEVPIRVRECPFCHHEFPAAKKKTLGDFELTEIDLLARSSFRWCDVNGNGSLLMASGFLAWSLVVSSNGHLSEERPPAEKVWYAVGGAKGRYPQVLYAGDRVACLASADDWMNSNESEDAAHKSRRWLQSPPTPKQLEYLPPDVPNGRLTRYKASCLLNLRFNRYAIDRALRSFRFANRQPIPAGDQPC